LGLDFLLCLLNFLLFEKDKNISEDFFLFKVTKDGEEKIKKQKHVSKRNKERKRARAI